MRERAIVRRLADLESTRDRFGPNEPQRVLRLLAALENSRLDDAASLIRFHEALLFLRAFPHSPAVLRKVESLLNTFHKRVEALRQSVADMAAFDEFETSGIAGTTMEDTLGFDVARWLTHHIPGQVEIAWDNYEPGRELGTTGPRFIPLLEDDAYVEADTPWRQWLETAAGRKDSAPRWLIERIAALPLLPYQKCELYESLRIPLRWHLANSRMSRARNFVPFSTLSSRPTRGERSDRAEWRAPAFPSLEKSGVFYHTSPLIPRSEVSLATELAKRPPHLKRLPRRQGDRIINLIREVMIVRYRELYGTTLGDPASVVQADVGRGVTIYLWNLLPDRRLPLRAYVAGLTLKNGVPINYIESIALCEWMEVGFNTFYTFRGGEAGWVYAQVLRCLCHLKGTTVVSVYPYQLGHDNEEAIASGAFWFYRKLGFRPGKPELQELLKREEKKIGANHHYRTPPRILKRLAAGHVFYELSGSQPGAWDKFSTRNIGLRVNQRMASQFRGDAQHMRRQTTQTLERILGVRTKSWRPPDQLAFENFALVLGEVRGLRAWTAKEKADLLSIIQAKSKQDEMLYLHLTQRHNRLRSALLKLGS
jgi:hypothetical protein